jgi:CDP-6-deoxy-D-xylo-4-hexulose-3-dehydrase
LGFCGDIDKIATICRKGKILLLEDNCESLGSRYRGRLLGNFGLASTFSTYVGHHLSTIEGGMVCTDDKELRDMLVMVRAHGWDRNLDPKRQKGLRRKNSIPNFYGKYAFYELAYNLRPTEVNGFIGLQQLPYLSDIVRKRAENFRRFKEALGRNRELEPLHVDHMDRVSNFAFPVIGKTVGAFQKYKKKFETNGVEIRPIVGGSMVEQPFFRKSIDRSAQRTCPNAARIHRQGFYFPNRPDLTSSEVAKLCRLLD